VTIYQRTEEIEADIDALQQELRTVRTEHERFARAIAISDDIGVLVREMKVRSARIQYLGAKVQIARKTPADIARLTSEIEANARAKLRDLQRALARPEDRRQVFLAMFRASVSPPTTAHAAGLEDRRRRPPRRVDRRETRARE